MHSLQLNQQILLVLTLACISAFLQIHTGKSLLFHLFGIIHRFFDHQLGNYQDLVVYHDVHKHFLQHT